MTRAKDNALSIEEVEKLINAAETPEEKLFTIGLIYTGCRIQEFCSLNKKDLDFVSNKIHIRGTKTEKANREIPMIEPRLIAILKGYFTLNDKISYSGSGAWRLIQRVAKRAGIEHKVYPHCLRATYASLLGHKYTLSTIMYFLGWKSATTANHYMMGDKTQAFNEVERCK
jgi:integrase/recombinase XerD